ncbi:MAG: ABC transporter ATP-binding protein [Actinobacteria bacterium]|nr:ABC transporter ATP-binding protein [Actinomycetota bacterium]
MRNPAIEIQGLTMRYGDVTAVRDLHLMVPSGQITAVLGRNGAGKTTTMEVCAGIRPAQSGVVQVLGANPIRDRVTLAPKVGVMLQSGGVPGSSRGVEFAHHLAGMYAHPLDVTLLAQRLGVSDVRTAYRRMSGGEQQRVRLICALVGRPELVILDEPTSGLDPLARGLVWNLLGDLKAAGLTVVVSTHQFDEAERLADHIVIVARGAVVASGSPRELGAADADRVTFLCGLHVSTEDLSRSIGVPVLEISPGRYVAEGALPDNTNDFILAWARDHGVVARDIVRGRRTLEDLFHEVSQ